MLENSQIKSIIQNSEHLRQNLRNLDRQHHDLCSFSYVGRLFPLYGHNLNMQA